MNAEFFTQLKNIGTTDFNLSISLSYLKNENLMTVSLLPIAKDNADPVLKKLKPLTLTATPEELDQKFFEVITEPIKDTVSFISSTSEYIKQQNQLKANTQVEKDKAEKVKKKEKELKELMGEESELQNNAKKIKSLIVDIMTIDPNNSYAKKCNEIVLSATAQESLF